MANTYLQNTTTTATDTKKFTWSMWVKRSLLGSPAQRIWNIYADTNNKAQVAFNTDDQFSYFDKLGGSEVWSQTPKMKLRDTSAWYHIVVAVDTTQGTEADRAKIYINGELQTELEAGGSYPSINASTGTQITTSSNNRRIGSNESANTHFNGLISHLHFVDGTAYPASTFGSTDSVTGEWKINTSPSITMGTNGFTILKDGNTITDQSSNSNNFTLGGGTLTKTEDCPSNVFATWNPLVANMDTLTNGNTSVARSGSGFRSAFSTIALPSTGKFYCEFKRGSGNLVYLGIADDKEGGCVDLQNRGQESQVGANANSVSYLASDGRSTINNSADTSYGASFSSSNVIGMAVDMTNMKLYFSKDGVFQNSGDPTSGSTGTGALSIPATTGTYFVAAGFNASGVNVNFGNGFFATTEISSDGTAASTPGRFEHNVPTGYQPLTTKGLNA